MSSGTAFDTVFCTLIFAKFCFSGLSGAETMAVFESSVVVSESSPGSVCTSVAAVVCESSDVAAFETSILKARQSD